MSEIKWPKQYEGTVVKVGNSRGMRLPAGFFHAHPEFNGKAQVTVVGDGAVLVSTKPSVRRKAPDEADPVVTGLLSFLEAQMPDRYRLFFRFSSAPVKVIVYVWFNDE